MKVGVCGTGIFARDSHLPALKQAGGIDVAACYNRTKPKAEEFAEKAGENVKVFDTLEELMNSDVDFLDILVPVDQNLEIIRKVLASKKPFCFEKPIAHNLKDAREIVNLVEPSNVPVMILENWIYHNATKKLQELLPQIGTPKMFVYQDTKPHALSKFHSTSWRMAPKHLGGYLSDAGVHDIAMLTEILGNVKSATAHTTQLQQISGTDDVLSAHVELESGAFGSYVFSTSLNGSDTIKNLQIYGTNGTITLDCKNDFTTITLAVGKGSEDIQQTLFEVMPDDIDGLVQEFRNFSEAVKAGDKSLIKATPRKGFHHFAVIVAMLESAQQGGKLVHVETM